MQSLIKNSMFRFLVIGGTATTIDGALYWFLTTYINPSLAKALSLSLAASYSYVANKKWTFADSSDTTPKKVVNYVLVQLVNLSINVGVNYLVLRLTENKFLSFLTATAVSTVVNYLLQRFWVFRVSEVSCEF